MEESNTWAVVWMHTIECVSVSVGCKGCVCVCMRACLQVLQGNGQESSIRHLQE